MMVVAKNQCICVRQLVFIVLPKFSWTEVKSVTADAVGFRVPEVLDQTRSDTIGFIQFGWWNLIYAN